MDLGTTIVGALAIIVVCGGLPIFILGIVLGLKMMNTRHAERMGLINQGIIPPDTPKTKAIPNRFVSLRNGIILVFLAIGIVAGALFPPLSENADFGRLFTLTASITFFIGLGYLTYFFISRKAGEKEEIEIENSQE